MQEYNNPGLRALLIINFDESLQFLLPDGEVPYTPNDAPAGTEHTRLTQEYRGLYRFFKGGDGSINKMGNNCLFNFLEGLHADEAELLVAACNRSLQDNYRVTQNVVAEAFPAIEWETEVDLKKEIETRVEDLFKADRNDFDFKEEEPESIDDLADQLFDALYEHTNVV